MKKWLIPVAALFVVAIIALITWQFVLRGPDKEHYTVYMIALNDNGKQGKEIGCGDSLVKVERQTVSDTRISDVYQDILGVDEQTDPGTGLTNALYQSDLRLDTATIQGGTARIYLSGTLKVAEGKCDAPRVQAQLEEPARQFEGVRSVEVYINNVALQEVL